MKVLLDHDLPVQIRRLLKGHLVLTAAAMNWNRLENGHLIAAAEGAVFDVLLTGDQNMYSQQSHRNRRIALVVLDRTNRNTLIANIDLVLDALSRAVPGGYELVPIPPERKRPRAVE